MRKPVFAYICFCKNKDAFQLRGNREADQRICFRYIDSTIPLLYPSTISNALIICANAQAHAHMHRLAIIFVVCLKEKMDFFHYGAKSLKLNHQAHVIQFVF